MSRVSSGDVEGVRSAIAEGVGLLDEMEDLSPLAIAVENRDLNMVQALLALGHNPNLGGIVVPLAEAASNGDTHIVEQLLQSGANVDEEGEEGETAIMWTARAGHLAIFQRLVEAGADIAKKDRDGRDALDYAVEGGCKEVIELLLPQVPKARQDKIRRKNHLQGNRQKDDSSEVARRLKKSFEQPEVKKKSSVSSLIRLFENGKHEELLKVLATGADVNESNREGTTLLGMVAGSSAIYTLLEPLLKAGADPNRGELFRPLSLVGWKGTEFVKMLLDAGADPNWADPDGHTALMSAATGDDVQSVRLLLEAGADPNAEDNDGHTPLWHALSRRNTEIAALLSPLTSDAEDAQMPWRKNKEGKSPELCLLDAAKGGDLDYVKKRLEEGLSADIANESGDTPLHLAAEKNDVAMMELLIRGGAPIEALGCGDKTPLQSAANRGCVAAARKLLDAGADVNAYNDDVLCFACENQNALELVDLLIQAGAAVNVTGGHRNVTPLHVATEHNEPAVVRRLLAAGADVHARDGNGWTPLLNAALRADVETVQLLIDAGSDVEALDSEGRTALDLASKWGKPTVAAFLKNRQQK